MARKPLNWMINTLLAINGGPFLVLRKCPLSNKKGIIVIICCSRIGDFITTKEKIGNAFKIKEHALKAVELNPKDATSFVVLGTWCFNVASVGWLERKVIFFLLSLKDILFINYILLS